MHFMYSKQVGKPVTESRVQNYSTAAISSGISSSITVKPLSVERGDLKNDPKDQRKMQHVQWISLLSQVGGGNVW